MNSQSDNKPTQPDFSIIEKAAENESAPTNIAPYYELEVQTLDNSKLEVELASAWQLIGLREQFAGQILLYLWIFSGFCGACIIAQALHLFGFALATPIMVTLVGGTAASAFGLVSVVLSGLFRVPAPPAPPKGG